MRKKNPKFAGEVGSPLCQWENVLGASVTGIVSTNEKAAQSKEDMDATMEGNCIVDWAKSKLKIQEHVVEEVLDKGMEAKPKRKMIGANVIVLGNVSDANIEDVCGQKIEVL
ncbi:hypothetical protein YC2023_020567 [Brassica napus]